MAVKFPDSVLCMTVPITHIDNRLNLHAKAHETDLHNITLVMQQSFTLHNVLCKHNSS